MNILSLFQSKDKKLGVSDGKHRYDIPLHRSADSKFLILLIALMTFLALMAIAGLFLLSGMTHHWSSGLNNKLTIEIPAEDETGMLRTENEISALIQRTKKQLEQNKHITEIIPLDRNEIGALLSPWLGEGNILEGIPLPGLISVEYNTLEISKLQKSLENIVPNIQLDTHESWMRDIMRFVGALQMTAGLLALIIGTTTIIAITGAIKSRIDIHKKDVELLHLMGATDQYIARQFQRHTMLLSLQGALAGGAFGIVTLLIVRLISGDTGAALLPEFSLSLAHIISILMLPFIICALATFTTRLTVLRSLSLMP